MFSTGQLLRHYKGSVYEVMGFATLESNLKPLVIYRERLAYGTTVGETWARPLSELLERVELPTGESVQRFTAYDPQVERWRALLQQANAETGEPEPPPDLEEGWEVTYKGWTFNDRMKPVWLYMFQKVVGDGSGWQHTTLYSHSPDQQPPQPEILKVLAQECASVMDITGLPRTLLMG